VWGLLPLELGQFGYLNASRGFFIRIDHVELGIWSGMECAAGFVKTSFASCPRFSIPIESIQRTAYHFTSAAVPCRRKDAAYFVPLDLTLHEKSGLLFKISRRILTGNLVAF